uniref:BTB domain-containing protein n=1 Tax=Branchiostoma floridae TaxID=7739 RepID=C3Z952_BRAFL|eukprot:XP_002594953.1 hypothetical protein BRAFLDRAFT_103714 [Branchiostoma floridae]
MAYHLNRNREWFFREMQQLRSNDVLVDVTLCAEGKEIPCHRVVLAAWSEYFLCMFSGCLSETKKDKIEIGGVSAEALQQLVDYAYDPIVDITEENVQPLFEAADMLQFRGVSYQCEQFLHQRVRVDTCLGIWALADRVSCTRLADKAKSCALKWFEEVCAATEDFLHLPVHLLQSYISDEGLMTKKEERILEVVMLWARHDLKERQKHLEELLKCVHFSRMDPGYLQNIVKEDKVLAGVVNAMMTIQPTHAEPRQIHQNEIFVLGGVTGIEETLHNEVCRLELDGHCVDTNPLPKPFKDSSGMAACVFGNDVVVTGGKKSMRQAWRYISSTNTWMKLANLGRGRYDHGMAILGDKLYVVGGTMNGRAGTRPWTSFPECRIHDVEVYEKKRNNRSNWKLTEPLPLAVSNFGITACHGKLYVFGGVTNNEDATNHVQHYDPTSTHKMWSLETGWVSSRVSHLSACTVDSKIYLVGGPLRWVLGFNPDALQEEKPFKTLAKQLAPWYHCSATVCGSDIYITGGKTHKYHLYGRHQPKVENFATVQCYNVRNNTMVLAKDLPKPLHGHCTVAITKT